MNEARTNENEIICPDCGGNGTVFYIICAQCEGTGIIKIKGKLSWSKGKWLLKSYTDKSDRQ